MRTLKKSHIRFTKQQRIGIFLLTLFILAIEFTIQLGLHEPHLKSATPIPNELLILQEQINVNKSKSTNQYNNYTYKEIQLSKFNPNSLSKNEWINLGFSEKQASVILKYKKSLGGNFLSKQQVKQCFVINDKKYNELEPYILLPNKVATQVKKAPTVQYKTKKTIQYTKFNPNEYSLDDWESLGFTNKQAQTIIKYKMSLGGNFMSLDQIQKCYVISDKKFQEIKPYMVIKITQKANKQLPSEKNNKEQSAQQKIEIKPFNPNTITKEEWLKLGFTQRQVKTIFNYKKSLGGKFKDAQTLKKCYTISDEKFKEIEPYLVFDY